MPALVAPGFPIATVAFYGPDDKRATKVAVAIILAEDEDPVELRRWFRDEGDVRHDSEISKEILEFVRTYGAKSIVSPDRIIGCPHEEGVDYAEGGSCPQCPFWGPIATVGVARWCLRHFHGRLRC